MYRCLELAELGAGNVAPNPMVGAVLVYNDQIIGEGYHQKYGDAHAEVNAIGQASGSGLIDRATLYVSLEPCAHFGKTPPCADLIIKHKIPRVVVGCRDPFDKVNGRGIEKLREAGVEVELGILEQECTKLNKRFFTFQTQHRPYIILKWAQTGDGFIDSGTSPHTPLQKRGVRGDSVKKRLLISNEYTNRVVHKWRSEEASILVGTNTVENDNPELTTRLWPGSSPVRLVIDMNLRLPSSSKVFNGGAKTIVFNSLKHDEEGNVSYYQVTDDVSLVHQVINALHQLKIQSVIVEGGARLLESFIEERMWDEARVITNEELVIQSGLKSPQLNGAFLQLQNRLFTDTIRIYQS